MKKRFFLALIFLLTESVVHKTIILCADFSAGEAAGLPALSAPLPGSKDTALVTSLAFCLKDGFEAVHQYFQDNFWHGFMPNRRGAPFFIGDSAVRQLRAGKCLPGLKIMRSTPEQIEVTIDRANPEKAVEQIIDTILDSKIRDWDLLGALYQFLELDPSIDKGRVAAILKSLFIWYCKTQPGICPVQIVVFTEGITNSAIPQPVVAVEKNLEKRLLWEWCACVSAKAEYRLLLILKMFFDVEKIQTKESGPIVLTSFAAGDGFLTEYLLIALLQKYCHRVPLFLNLIDPIYFFMGDEVPATVLKKENMETLFPGVTITMYPTLREYFLQYCGDIKNHVLMLVDSGEAIAVDTQRLEPGAPVDSANCRIGYGQKEVIYNLFSLNGRIENYVGEITIYGDEAPQIVNKDDEYCSTLVGASDQVIEKFDTRDTFLRRIEQSFVPGRCVYQGFRDLVFGSLTNGACIHAYILDNNRIFSLNCRELIYAFIGEPTIMDWLILHARPVQKRDPVLNKISRVS